MGHKISEVKVWGLGSRVWALGFGGLRWEPQKYIIVPIS